MDCIFCKLANKEIATDLVYEDDYLVAFNDMNPQAPVHILFVAKKHYVSHHDVEEKDLIISHIFAAIRKVAEEKGLDKTGYRIINNIGQDGGQTVMHMHFHLLAGKKLGDSLV
ncbi:MAG: histidine triad nucleotide-binding protein [Tissierellia bacterium]|nr:histidine triad nucleotide-binding protein [Tissierellia bacterium]